LFFVDIYRTSYALLKIVFYFVIESLSTRVTIMKLFNLKNKRYFVCFIFGCLLYFFVIRHLIYLYCEFIISVNVNVETCDKCSMKYQNDARKTKNISNIVHQIFFPVKSKTPPKALMDARASCVRQNKNFTHYLWNETEVVKFIRREYPHMEKRYRSYDYWVRRVNVARYLILYHYGGWYVDLDMTCVQR
jgi:mannosyltransferase OCH1-like enzyme